MSETRRDAKFDLNGHCVQAGWATYLPPRTLRQRLHERLTGHRTPRRVPPNDHAPATHDRCPGCGMALSWFNPGTHRHGGYSKAVFDAYRRERAQ